METISDKPHVCSSLKEAVSLVYGKDVQVAKRQAVHGGALWWICFKVL
ncbi:hypothetical protein [Butyrivibrio sp. AE3004]|nr:hypothetical protein [Butyrivibrio sp. AE3004]